jgi:hypothetical protein
LCKFQLNCLWIRTFFLAIHPRSERFRGVVVKNRATPHENGRAMVVLLVDFMHGAAALALAGGKNGCVHACAVHALTTEAGEESRVNVQRAPTPKAADLEVTQVSRKAHKVDARRGQAGVDAFGKPLAGRNHGNAEAKRSATRNARDFLAMRDHKNNSTVDTPIETGRMYVRGASPPA